jgi:hypothetical protein
MNSKKLILILFIFLLAIFPATAIDYKIEPASDDILIRQDDTLYPTTVYFFIGKDNAPGVFFRTAIKFNLSEINDSNDVINCTMQLTLRNDYLGSLDPVDIAIYNLTQDWKESDAGLLNYSMITSGNLVNNYSYANAYWTPNTAYNISINKTICQDWLQAGYNYGLGLRCPLCESTGLSSSQFNFYSSENVNPIYRPILYLSLDDEDITIPSGAISQDDCPSDLPAVFNLWGFIFLAVFLILAGEIRKGAVLTIFGGLLLLVSSLFLSPCEPTLAYLTAGLGILTFVWGIIKRT